MLGGVRPAPLHFRAATAAFMPLHWAAVKPVSVSNSGQAATPVALMALSKFARESGISPVTLWRWRRLGWLQTLNVAGRQYISGQAIAEFQRRAEAGEFAKVHVVPQKPNIRA